jgi:hypothetical protein
MGKSHSGHRRGPCGMPNVWPCRLLRLFTHGSKTGHRSPQIKSTFRHLRRLAGTRSSTQSLRNQAATYKIPDPAILNFPKNDLAWHIGCFMSYVEQCRKKEQRN